MVGFKPAVIGDMDGESLKSMAEYYYYCYGYCYCYYYHTHLTVFSPGKVIEINAVFNGVTVFDMVIHGKFLSSVMPRIFIWSAKGI